MAPAFHPTKIRGISRPAQDWTVAGPVRLRPAPATVALIAITVLVLLVMADLPPNLPPTVRDCAAISSSNVRLRCYDAQAAGHSSQPARGATAPNIWNHESANLH
jgi:hypothetical protein